MRSKSRKSSLKSPVQIVSSSDEEPANISLYNLKTDPNVVSGRNSKVDLKQVVRESSSKKVTFE